MTPRRKERPDPLPPTVYNTPDQHVQTIEELWQTRVATTRAAKIGPFPAHGVDRGANASACMLRPYRPALDAAARDAPAVDGATVDDAAASDGPAADAACPTLPMPPLARVAVDTSPEHVRN